MKNNIKNYCNKWILMIIFINNKHNKEQNIFIIHKILKKNKNIK